MVMGKENIGFYGYFFFVCLLVGYEHCGFYFLIMFVVSWFFFWMHFWWCGCFSANVLMDVNKEKELKMGIRGGAF
jgi:hypothetical protein